MRMRWIQIDLPSRRRTFSKTATALVLAFSVSAVAGAIPPPQQDPAQPSQSIEYPLTIRGTWIPLAMSCTSAASGDSDALIVIEARSAARYEDSSWPRAVTLIAEDPQTWLIESMISIGGHPPEAIAEVFALSQGGLIVISRDQATIYQRCR